MSLYVELKRRNVFRVAIAYLAIAWLLIEIASTLFPVFGIPDWGIRFLVILFLLGFVPSLVFSWAYELTPDGIKREKDVVRETSVTHLTAKRLDVLTIGVVVLAMFFVFADRMWLAPMLESQETAPAAISANTTHSEAEESLYTPNSIAVLPFVNMSSDAEQEYFSDGLTEELLNILAQLPDLKVIARTSSFAFKGKDVGIADIARELKVPHILEGSVRKQGNQIRITAQLIRTSDSFHIWSATYDRDLDNIFRIQDEIAAAVVGELEIALLGDAMPRATATDPEAYALYLQSQHVLRRHTKEAYAEAESMLNKALAIDPDFAPAWHRLGGLYWGRQDFGDVYEEANALAERAFQRALTLDPDYVPAYASLSLLARSRFDYATAESYLQTALRFSEESAFPNGAAASLSRTFGRFELSIDFAEKSIALDPVRATAYSNLGYSCYYANRLDEAATAFRKSISLQPTSYRHHFYLGRVLLAQGALSEALVEMNKENDEMMRLTGLAMVYYVAGDIEASDKAVASLIEKFGEHDPFQIAEVYGLRGDSDQAFEWLHKAFEIRDPGLNVFLGDPAFAAITSDPRYRSLLEELDLLTYWQEMSEQAL